jgi:hypothetical protein
MRIERKRNCEESWFKVSYYHMTKGPEKKYEYSDHQDIRTQSNSAAISYIRGML